LYQNDGDALISSYIFLDMTKPSGKQLFLEMVSQQSLPKDLHPKLKFAGIKLYLDGALGSRGAHLFEDYTDDPGNRGLRLMDDNEALMLMGLAAEHHLQIAVHAIGDAANSRALDLYAEIRKRYPQSKSLMRIEHSQIVRSSDIPRYHELDIWAVIQPQFWLSDHQWAVQRLGEDRMQNAYRWRSLLEAGINVAASSDSPVEEADPLLGIAAFRSDRDEAIGTDQAEILYSPNDLLNIIS
jgi:predicted amidohydrolase YtcJ